MNETMRETTERALAILKARYKTYNAAAEELGVTRQALRDWRLRGAVSYLKVQRVSEITEIPIEVLRPDLFAESGENEAMVIS